MREAMTKKREAADLEVLALEGERNIYSICQQMMVYGHKRADVVNERTREEARVAEMATSLERLIIL